MAFIRDATFDVALNDIKNNASRFDFCSQEPTTYAEATSTYTLANKTGIAFTGPAAGDTSGRKVSVNTFTDGTVTGTGSATHWALTDGSSVLYAAGSFASPVSLTSGGQARLDDPCDIEFPDAVSE